MKNLLISATLALSSLTAISASANTNASNTMPHNNMQPQMHHNNTANSGQRGQHMGNMGMRSGMDTMMAELNLTANQKAQIQALRQNNRGNRMQNREAMLKILTPEQRQKLDQMRSKYMNQGGHMMKRGHMNQEGHMMNQGHMHQNNHMNQ